MAILIVYQAKTIKELPEGSSEPGLMQELCKATDFTLWATKVTAQALGRTMATLVVQQWHLWHNLAEMRVTDKACILDTPISQAGLFSGGDFAQ